MVAGLEETEPYASKIWGLFENERVTSEQASLEPFKSRAGNREAYRLSFHGLIPEKAILVAARLERATGTATKLFEQVRTVNNPGVETQDVVAVIAANHEAELVPYLKRKGVAFEGKHRQDKAVETTIAWSKELAFNVLQDLTTLWPECNGNSSLKGQIKQLQNTYLVIIRDSGPDQVDTQGLDTRLKNFMEEAANNVASDRGKALLAKLNERIEQATREVEAGPGKEEVRNQELEKFTAALTKAGKKDLAERLNEAMSQGGDEALLAELTTMQNNGELTGKLRGLSKGLQSSLNGVGAAIG